MAEIFFTSDLHFCHNKEFLYGPRGFKSVDEMNEAIVERWNSIVKPEDTVYNLGDIAFGDIEQACLFIKRLNGYQNWIIGNHDSVNKYINIKNECSFQFLPNNAPYADIYKHGKLTMYLSHYPTLTSNFDEKHFSQHVINLHGHTHQQTNWLFPDNPFIYHVGMDSHNCAPVHIDEILADIKNRWDAVGAIPMERAPLYNYPLKGDANELEKGTEYSIF